jgi:osmotically inducible protein OsmC
MPKRKSNATWEGGLKGGKGHMKIGRTGFEGPYSFTSRFEEGAGTNPEELIAGAHAGCFSMALSADLEAAGHKPKSVSTVATVSVMPQEGGGFAITNIMLETTANVPGIKAEEFTKIAEGAKTGCPVSKALSAVQIDLEAKLVS